MKPDFIYLASQSPRRRQLLEQLGVRYELLLPDDDEDAEALEAVLPGEAPAPYVQRVTDLKLQASLARLKRRQWPVAPILCADTTVALGRKILGKPASDAQARAMLQDLSGRDHRVLTAVAMGQGRRTLSLLSQSRVRFAPLSSAWIAAYVASGEPHGKAGAYAIQGRASVMMSSISGSYSGIMGLPLFETGQLLRSFGFKL
jgi:septum formation protein